MTRQDAALKIRDALLTAAELAVEYKLHVVVSQDEHYDEAITLIPDNKIDINYTEKL